MVEYVLEKQVALRKSQFNVCATSVSTFYKKKRLLALNLHRLALTTENQAKLSR